MKWTIDFYDEEVRESIHTWPKKIRLKFLWITDLIKKVGPSEIGMPHIEPFGQGLFEIRAKAEEGIGRAFFCIRGGKVVIVLNGFIKKSQKTPPKEIALARKRMKEIKK